MKLTLLTSSHLDFFCGSAEPHFVQYSRREKEPEKITRVVAHRGFWDTEGSAQNSIASLQKAARHEIWGIEFDVRLTSDGEVILFHDRRSMKYRSLRSPLLIWRTTDYRGEPITTLDQFFTEDSKYPDIRLICELKPGSELFE